MTQITAGWILAIIAALGYFAAGLKIVRVCSRGVPEAGALKPMWWLSFAAALVHTAAVGCDLFGPGTVYFGFGMALSIALLFAVFITLVESFVRRVSGLMGVLLFVAAVCALMPVVFPGEAVASETWTVLFRVHLIVALGAYSFMTIAFLQAVLLWMMQRQLKDPAAAHKTTGLVANMPNLMAMERILYRIVLCGFVCLTLVLIIGSFATQQYMGQPFVFDHKTVLTWISWIVFAVLMVGRYFFGWRNKRALMLFWAGYAFLVAAYVVYRFVIELFLS